MKNKRVILFATCLLLLLVVFYFRQHREKPRTFAETKTVYLTFDDGPSSKVTPKILDVLKDEGVPATFFVVGKQIEGREDILKRIVDEGHSVGIHSYTHEYKAIYESKESLLKDIQKTGLKIEAVTGVLPTLYRFPGGSHSVKQELISAVKEAGYRAVDWNCCDRDEELYEPSVSELIRATVSSAKGKNQVVVLCHDSTNHLNTAYALPTIISYFRSEGFVFEKL